MVKKTIVQVLGGQYYKEVEFMVNNRDIIISQLSSIALYNSLKSKEVEVILYVPESVVVNLYENPENALEHIKSSGGFLDDYIKTLNLNLDDNFKVKPIQSIGLYKSKHDYEMNFDNCIENIIIQFMSDLISIEGELIIDISTGLNFYVRSLSETAKNLLVYNHLKTILQTESKLQVKTVIVPPIMQDIKGPYPITFLEDNAKTFFEFPYKDLCIHNHLITINKGKNYLKEIFRAAPQISKYIKNKVIKVTYLAFNAIQNNVPLALFSEKIIMFMDTENIVKDQIDQIKSLPDFINNHAKFDENKAKIIINRFKTKKNNILNFLFTLGLYESLKKFYDDKIANKEPTLDYIENTFAPLYAKIGLGVNKRFLERDIKDIKQLVENLEKDQEKCLKDLQSTKNFNEPSNQILLSTDIKRIFFAHSGFLRDFTLVRKVDNDNILVKYKDDNINEIIKWLKDPS